MSDNDKVNSIEKHYKLIRILWDWYTDISHGKGKFSSSGCRGFLFGNFIAFVLTRYDNSLFKEEALDPDFWDALESSIYDDYIYYFDKFAISDARSEVEEFYSREKK
jgi:hypothetical protein